ncbi:DUF305 domain-containing protein [Longimicrobium sp.]|uniref:DUF305 domain-containing protein n=1 Tax=Longimicrobium sp. TaxID=2029185 RepID=UPI002CD3AAAD|nr:DUF305 domain-containing protein [Longimicrobium sp.]HSU12505.1 DUF305 domain-containing protein [Longimicrobium sp.]
MLRRGTMAAAMLVLATAACGTAAGQTQPAAAPMPMPADTARPGVSPADVAFMRGMIAHHGQALEMTALVPARTTSESMRLLARRIDISQQGEMAMMRRWLADRGQDTTAAMQHDMHAGMPGMQHAAMPGMLTPEEMARLAAATGPGFERLFLEGMIRHHEGALRMVADLLATPGAAQDSETFRFASDVDADQRAEIARMQAMLATLQTPR